MIEQQGQVVKIAQGRVFVRVGSRLGCAACDAGRGCGAGIFSRLAARRPVTLETDLTDDVRLGQSVVIGVEEDVFLTLLARLYLLPLVAGLAGASIGHYIFYTAESRWIVDLSTLAGAVMLAAVAMLWNRTRSEEFSRSVIVHFLHVVDDGESTVCSGIDNRNSGTEDF